MHATLQNFQGLEQGSYITHVCGRHWKEVMRISGHELDLAPETFKLQHLLNAKLLAHKEEVHPHVTQIVVTN